MLDSFRKEASETEGKQNYIWEVWVENKTGDYWSYSISPEGSGMFDYLVSSYLGPQGKELSQLFLSTEEQPGELSLILDGFSYSDTRVEENGAFVLKAE